MHTGQGEDSGWKTGGSSRDSYPEANLPERHDGSINIMDEAITREDDPHARLSNEARGVDKPISFAHETS